MNALFGGNEGTVVEREHVFLYIDIEINKDLICAELCNVVVSSFCFLVYSTYT